MYSHSNSGTQRNDKEDATVKPNPSSDLKKDSKGLEVVSEGKMQSKN